MVVVLLSTFIQNSNYLPLSQFSLQLFQGSVKAGNFPDNTRKKERKTVNVPLCNEVVIFFMRLQIVMIRLAAGALNAAIKSTERICNFPRSYEDAVCRRSKQLNR